MKTGQQVASKSENSRILTAYDSVTGRYAPLFAVALLACLTLALYLPTLRHSFLNYDDDEYVSANAHLGGGLTAANLKWAFTNVDVGHWQPLTWITHLADCGFYGLSPRGHHLSSVLLHTLNVCLLFLLVYRISGAPGRSLFVAALFAVHPVNVEVVAWIAERKTLVCTLFTFITFAAYVWYAKRPGWARYLAVAAAFCLAVMSKSMAVTIPLLLVLLDVWVLQRWKSNYVSPQDSYPPQSTYHLLLEKIPLLTIAVLISLLTLHAQEKGHAVNHDALLPRLGHALWSCFAYIGKLIWPSDLSIIYPYPTNGHPGWTIWLALIGLALLCVIALRARSKPYLAFGWFFYLIGMLPVIGIIRVGPQSLSDHYLYVPAIGLFLVATWGANDLLNRLPGGKRLAAVAAIVVIAAYAVVTRNYLPAWQNSYTLFSRAERLSPAADDMIENNLAEGLRELGRPAEAIPHYRAAIQLAPQMPVPHCSLGSALVAVGNPTAAITEFEIGLAQQPTGRARAQCLNNLGVTQLVLNQPALAQQSFTDALRSLPNFASALMGRGVSRLRLGDLNGAADDLRRAIELNSDPSGYYWLGETLLAMNSRDAAVSAFKQALALAPGNQAAAAELAKLTQGR